MARQEHVLTVFVASPGDVDSERDKLEDVIRELNVTWSRELGVRLDLVRWETHAYPSIGVDAQDVINEQIPEDYDIFVGIMWHRYGTPTGRAGSGTAEEFDRAKARHDNDPSCVQMMIYFKDEAIAPSLLDPEQLAKVNVFRKSLGTEGTLYWKFNGIDQFEQLIRLHLTRQVQAWKSLAGSPVNTNVAEPVIQPKSSPNEDDDGILDLMELFEDRFADLREISTRIAAATEEIGQKILGRTAEIKALPRDQNGYANRKDAKRSIAKAAMDMKQYTVRIEAELPLFRDAMNTGMKSFMKATTMSVDIITTEEDFQQAKYGLDAVIKLHGTLATSKQSMSVFRESVATLPRMTTELNRAKLEVTEVLDRLLAEFNNGETLLTESEKVIRDLIGEKAL
jgi:hypothetical protein